MSKILKREDILNAKDMKEETVQVPEWGGAVVVKMMSGQERDAFEASCRMQAGNSVVMNTKNLRAKLVAATVIDPDTKELLFTPGDIEALGKKSVVPLDRIFEAASKLSKISESDVDELVKNSPTDQSDSGTTD